MVCIHSQSFTRRITAAKAPPNPNLLTHSLVQCTLKPLCFRQKRHHQLWLMVEERRAPATCSSMPKKLLDIQIAAHGKASGPWGTNIRMSLQSPFGLQTRWLWSIGLILQHQITVWVLQGYHLIIPKRFSGMAMNSLLCPTKTGPLRWDMVLCDKVLEPGQKHEKVARSIHWIHWKTEQHMPSICPATAFCNWSPYHQDSFGMVWSHIKKLKESEPRTTAPDLQMTLTPLARRVAVPACRCSGRCSGRDPHIFWVTKMSGNVSTALPLIK